MVSVVIPTWNRAQLVTERAIASVLRQTYQNLEVIVVGDHCTDDTEERIGSLGDSRVRFTNLKERGRYPDDPFKRWCVAGSVPTNEGFRLAGGEWIAQLDDDDIWTPDHIETLLRRAESENLEFVYAKVRRWIGPDEWIDRGEAEFRRVVCLPSTCLFRSYLRLFKSDSSAWKIGWGADSHRAWRMYRAGVRAGFVDQVVAESPLRPGVSSPGHLSEDREGATEH